VQLLVLDGGQLRVGVVHLVLRLQQHAEVFPVAAAAAMPALMSRVPAALVASWLSSSIFSASPKNSIALLRRPVTTARKPSGKRCVAERSHRTAPTPRSGHSQFRHAKCVDRAGPVEPRKRVVPPR